MAAARARRSMRRGADTVREPVRWAKIAEAISPPDPPRFVRLEVAAGRTAALVVEVGAARIVVERGFNVVHLRAVVAALAAERAT